MTWLLLRMSIEREYHTKRLSRWSPSLQTMREIASLALPRFHSIASGIELNADWHPERGW